MSLREEREREREIKKERKKEREEKEKVKLMERKERVDEKCLSWSACRGTVNFYS